MSYGSTIVFGGSQKKRESMIDSMLEVMNPSYANKEHPDLLFVSDSVNKSSIGIAQVKSAISFLSTKPYSSHYKVVVILKAEKLTSQAQNALLKTLEEPPAYAIIILSSKTEESLLPTVISRCKKISAKENIIDVDERAENLHNSIIEKGMGERIDIAAEIAKKEKDEIIEFLRNLVILERNMMLLEPAKRYTDNIELISNAIKDMEDTNVNTKHCLENLFLHLC